MITWKSHKWSVMKMSVLVSYAKSIHRRPTYVVVFFLVEQVLISFNFLLFSYRAWLKFGWRRWSLSCWTACWSKWKKLGRTTHSLNALTGWFRGPVKLYWALAAWPGPMRWVHSPQTEFTAKPQIPRPQRCSQYSRSAAQLVPTVLLSLCCPWQCD